MLRAGSGCSTAKNPRSAAAEATAAALSQAGLTRAEGAICFVSSAHGAAYPLILRTIAHEAGTGEVAGCGAAGVIGAGREVESGPAVSVLVFGGGDIAAHRVFAPSLRGRSAEVAAEIISAVRPAIGATNLLCLFPDTYNNQDSDTMLATLSRELPGVTIVGGGATEDGSIGETFQFCGDTVSSNSIGGMLITGDFTVNVATTVACTAIGPPHRVTAVRDNVVFQLDGKPAYQVFHDAIGPLAADLRRAMAYVFVGIPLDRTAERLEPGKYFVRNIIGASEEHGVIAVGHQVEKGDLISLMLRDGERSRADLKASLEELGSRLHDPPAFGLYFDCASRGSGLYGIPDHDSAYMRQYLGDVPVGGFFSGFEIGPIGPATGMLMYSGVLALVSPKSK